MVPESPRWLVTKGRFDEALKILKTGAKMNKKTLPSDNEMIEMMEKIKLQDEQDAPAEEEVKSMKERVSMTRIWPLQNRIKRIYLSSSNKQLKMISKS